MLNRSIKPLSYIILLLMFCAFQPVYLFQNKVKVIVLDAGHGGHDSGCLGKKSKEKDVALAIVLKLGKQIENQFKDVKVVYTRKTDHFVELFERAAIANRHNANCFISIHCNSGPKTAYGTETYAMGLHKTEANLNVAKRENAVILLEDNYEKNYDGFDPKSPEAHVIFSLFQSAYMEQSLNLAQKVDEALTDNAKRSSRGVKQAGFLVLFKTSMPSILIESGFLTNENEEQFLRDSLNQEVMAKSIFKAIKNYKQETEG